MKISNLIRVMMITCLILVIFFENSGEVFAVQKLKPLFQKALMEGKEGNFENALILWDQLIEISPEDAAAFSNRGNVKLVLGDSIGAISDQTRAINLMPTEIDPYLNRGLA